MFYEDINITKRKTITNGAKYDFFIYDMLSLEKKHSNKKFGKGETVISKVKKFQMLDDETGEMLDVKIRCSKKLDDALDGNEWWNLRTYNNQEVAPGLYIYVVETPGGEKLIDACVKKLNQGTPIIIFPEGTRSLPQTLRLFKRSAAWIALKSDFPIVPAVLSITAPILMKDWKWYHVPSHSMEMLVDIHEPIIVEKVLNNPKYDTVSARKLTSHLQQFFESKVILNDTGSNGK